MQPSLPFDRQHLSTRSRLLDAAALEIAARGFEGTSVRQIAAAAGLTSGAIYRHFPEGKSELYAEILKFVSESMRAMVSENLGKSDDPLELVTTLCGRCWDFFASYPSFAALIAREGISGGPSSPYFGDNVAVMKVFKQFLRASAKAGAVRDVHAAHFAFAAGSYCINFHGAVALRDSLFEKRECAEGRALFLQFVQDMLRPERSG